MCVQGEIIVKFIKFGIELFLNAQGFCWIFQISSKFCNTTYACYFYGLYCIWANWFDFIDLNYHVFPKHTLSYDDVQKSWAVLTDSVWIQIVKSKW